RSLAASEYPDYEVVVVDDGSTDGTPAIVAGLGLDRVHLVRQDNAGKATALNTGIELSEAEVVVMVDGDTQFEPQTLRRLMEARAWTEAPSTLTALWRQRYRWSFGTMQSVWKHRRAVWSRDPRQRRIGRRALPYMFLFQILLPLTAPLIDLFAIYGLIFTDPVAVIAAWGAFNLVQLGMAIFAFRLDRESLRPLWALPLQQ